MTQDGYSCARKRISYLTNAEAENASFASHPGPRDNRSECRSDVDVDRPSNPWAPRKILSSQLTQEAHRKRCDYFKTRIGRCRPRARTAVSHRGFRAFGGGDRMQLANRRFLLRAMCPPHFSKVRFRPAGVHTAALKRSLMKLRRTMKPTQFRRLRFYAQDTPTLVNSAICVRD